MERLQRSMNSYVKWLGRRGDASEDKDRSLPASFLGRTMISHGEEFQPDSEFGNCLIAVGRANERIAGLQETFVNEATTTWLESLERSLAMMKEYQVSNPLLPGTLLTEPYLTLAQAARKKLENRRLAYDASMTKLQKARRDDFRIEEELRAAKAKYEESSEDVVRRMQDIRDAEVDSVRDLTQFMDAELDYHERCAEELRRMRKTWASGGGQAAGGNGMNGYGGLERRPTGRSRSNTAQSFTDRLSRTSSRIHEADEVEKTPSPIRMPIRSDASRNVLAVRQPNQQVHDTTPRPMLGKASTFQGGASLEREQRIGGRISGANTPNSGYGVNQNVPNVGNLRGQLRPVSRIVTNKDDVFADREEDNTSDGGSPDWCNRSESPATSVSSFGRPASTYAVSNNNGNSGLGIRKAPPPPPPSRSKKPAPPVPARREVGY